MGAFPYTAYRLYSKRGDSDCSIASMATVFRKDYEEVLIAAEKVAPKVWRDGLSIEDMQRVARRLKVPVRVRAAASQTIDLDEETGILWLQYNDDAHKHHVVSIFEGGWLADPEYSPVVIAEYDHYLRVHNAYVGGLLQVKE